MLIKPSLGIQLFPPAPACFLCANPLQAYTSTHQLSL